MKKIIVLLLYIVLITAFLTACGSGMKEIASGESPASATAPDIAEPAEHIIDYTEVYANYLAVFRERQSDIEQYTWHMGDGQAAICDVIGDDTPELLFVTKYGEYGEAYLNIYRYEDGDSFRVYYEPVDINAGSGTFYCLFTTEDGEVMLYERGAGEERTYSYKELELNANGGLAVAGRFTHMRTPSEDYSTFTHKYAQDGAEISESKFAALENELAGGMKDVVIWSCTEEDGIVWDKISEIGGNSAMSAEDALAFLTDNAGESTAGSAPSETAAWRSAYAEVAASNEQTFTIAGNQHTVQFSLPDMDSNGVPELIIYNGYYMSCSVYTYSGGDAVLLDTYGGGAAYWAWVYTDGVMAQYSGEDEVFWTLRNGQMVQTPFADSDILECYDINSSNIQSYILAGTQ